MTALTTAALAALVVGSGHYLAHRGFGDEVYFSKSGVNQAGLVVTALTFVVTYAVLSGLLADASAALAGVVR